jgi:SAM-dependent methyltransferase
VTDQRAGETSWVDDPAVISDQGERVSHLNPDHVYYGHLSIYAFAARFARDAVVLDAGSGAGYGAARLVDEGARYVYGLDNSDKAVAFCRHHFMRPNLAFQVCDLNQRLPFADEHFDFIFTSNTLEHVPDVPGFLREACRVLKPSGALLVAVPPITNDRLLYLNVINPYHVNLWSPRQWDFTLRQFFGHVEAYGHGIGHPGLEIEPDFVETPPRSEDGYFFEPRPLPGLYQLNTLTAIFVCQRPSAAPPATTRLQFVDDSFSRPVGFIAPAVRQRLAAYFDPPPPPPPRIGLVRTALLVARREGLGAFVRGLWAFVRRGFRRL